MSGSGRRKNEPRAPAAELRTRLLALRDTDLAVRDELVREGVLWESYHPRMEEVHLRNSAELSRILDEHGWPSAQAVGQDGVEAAWMLLMHSISNPGLLRRGRDLLRVAVSTGEATPDLLARVDDRIRTLEGQPQMYGTLMDWDDEGNLSPLAIADPDGVDRRRSGVGLPPLSEQVSRAREAARINGDRPPEDRDEKSRQYAIWLRRTGWR